MNRLLYVSFDGVLQPLAFSQVVRPVAALAQRGFGYHLLSLERTRDLADPARVRRVREALGGVPWTPIGVDLGSARRSGEAFSRMIAAGLAIARREGTTLVHARGHQGAVVAVAAAKALGTRYLFDVRGCWIEERPDWFSRPSAFALGKLAERQFYEGAAGYSTLTELLANDIAAGAYRTPGRPLRVITTCADFDEFCLAPRSVEAGAAGPPEELRRALAGRTVVGIVGSLNRSYAVEATMELARRILAASPTTHLLVLSHQTAEYRERLAREGIAESRSTVHAVAHDEMRHWLPWIDWGMLLLHEVAAKRGSMPTKLAEFFATGVRPLAFGCNSEMMSWVRRTGSGLALDSLEPEALDAAAARVAHATPDHDAVARAREIARPHFSLEAGVQRYAELLGEVARAGPHA
ncbi:MAG TPA: hypothetical protein PLR99_06605 [Polyangiaceae bacterium]|nr:hypothetical protein [Polyangiaceae bacterium]